MKYNGCGHLVLSNFLLLLHFFLLFPLPLSSSSWPFDEAATTGSHCVPHSKHKNNFKWSNDGEPFSPGLRGCCWMENKTREWETGMEKKRKWGAVLGTWPFVCERFIPIKSFLVDWHFVKELERDNLTQHQPTSCIQIPRPKKNWGSRICLQDSSSDLVFGDQQAMGMDFAANNTGQHQSCHMICLILVVV